MPRRRPFRYETLLRVRERAEEVKARALVRVRLERLTAEQEQVEILDMQGRVLRQVGEAMTGPALDAWDVQRYFMFERHLAHLAAEKAVAIALLYRNEEECRSELEEAMKQRRIVERLKERHTEAFLADARKEEQTFADEVASINAGVSGQLSRHTT